MYPLWSFPRLIKGEFIFSLIWVCTHEFFTLLGDYTLGAHLKDFKVIDTLLLRFEEEYIGYGMMDQVYFLKRMQEICPDAHILVEHIPRDKFEPSFNETIKYSKKAEIIWEEFKLWN